MFPFHSTKQEYFYLFKFQTNLNSIRNIIL